MPKFLFCRLSLKSLSFFFCCVLILTACGGGGGSNESTYQSPESNQADQENGNGDLGSETDNSTEPETNQAPTVDVGSDIVAWIGDQVILSGTASDSDGSIANYQWLQLSGPEVNLNNADSAQASFSIEGVADASAFTFSLTVTDNNGAQTSDQLAVTLNSRLEAAIRTGDPALLQGYDALLLDSILDDFINLNQTNQDHLQTIYQDQAISYSPGSNSQWLQYKDFGRYIPLLSGNKGKILAAAADANGQRYAAFGSNPIKLFQSGSNLDYQPHFKNLLAWLLKLTPNDAAQKAKVALTMLDNSSETNSRNWIETNYPNWDIVLCKDESVLASCLDGSDLVITGSSDGYNAETVVAALNQAKNAGAALLYQHVHSWNTSELTNPVLSVMGFSMNSYGGNYWSKDAASWQNVTEMSSNDQSLAPIETMLNHFKAEDYSFDWSACTSYVGSTSCNDVVGLDSEFEDGAGQVRSILGVMTNQALPLFEESGYRIMKQLVLLGDLYRKDIHYVMDKETTNTTEFLKAYYADHAVYYLRDINPVQLDLGNFSDQIPEEHTTVSKTLEITPNEKGGWTAIGLYALPGRTVTIRRTDNDSSDAYIFINTQRTGSSRVYNKNHYNRPKYLRSQSVLIRAGETISLTSPYGGTIQLDPRGEETLTLQIDNAAEHAFMNDMAQTDKYIADLGATQLSWTQISTPFVQIHALVDHMRTGISNAPYNGDMKKYLDDIWTFLIQDSYNLAGFVGDGLSHHNAITDMCQSLQWDCNNASIHGAPRVQHINVDKHANCGSACSGNPYDQSGPIRPKGWGESHEIGHNLQRSRLKIYGGRSSEVTNQIFPLHKYITWNEAYPDLTLSKNMKYKETFEAIQQGIADNDLYNSAYNSIWANDGYAQQNYERMTFLMQIMHKGSELASLNDGWQLFTMMYLHDRQFGAISTGNWEAEKSKIGFGNYVTKPSIDGNDFMLISLSFLTQQDQRIFFDLWGITYSDEASTQVAAYGYAETEQVFYLPEEQNYAKPVQHKIALDGVTAWPLP